MRQGGSPPIPAVCSRRNQSRRRDTCSAFIRPVTGTARTGPGLAPVESVRRRRRRFLAASGTCPGVRPFPPDGRHRAGPARSGRGTASVFGQREGIGYVSGDFFQAAGCLTHTGNRADRSASPCVLRLEQTVQNACSKMHCTLPHGAGRECGSAVQLVFHCLGRRKSQLL
jgi:hypothetical protein